MWPSNKYICYPFVQFIELSEVSGPARPQIGPVRWEMERELSGPLSLPHHHRIGISIRPDRLRSGVQVAHGKQHRGSARRKALLTQIQVLLFSRKPVMSVNSQRTTFFPLWSGSLMLRPTSLALGCRFSICKLSFIHFVRFSHGAMSSVE